MLLVQCIAYVRILCFTDSDLDEHTRQVDAEIKHRLETQQSSSANDNDSSGSEDINPYSARKREICRAQRIKVFSMHNELLAVRRLRVHLNELRTTRKTTLHEDRQLLEHHRKHSGGSGNDGEDGDSGRIISALHYRITKKEILDSTIAKLEILETYIQAVLELKPVQHPLLVIFHVITRLVVRRLPIWRQV
jgi:hypothetical protein